VLTSVRRKVQTLSEKKRFIAGTKVAVLHSKIHGTVTSVEATPTFFGEYLHNVQTVYGEHRDPGCNLKLIPRSKV
jgi:hypothetical protein